MDQQSLETMAGWILVTFCVTIVLHKLGVLTKEDLIRIRDATREAVGLDEEAPKPAKK